MNYFLYDPTDLCEPTESFPDHFVTGSRPVATTATLRRHLLCCGAILCIFACLILVSLVILTEMSRAAFASRVADQVLRFHVIAHSDDPEDQALKLDVRDALIAYMARYSSQFDSADEAALFAADHCNELQQIAQNTIRQAGYSYPVTATVTTCDFPDKTYGDLTFPAGEYQALNIEIGQAQGQNWWCVLYPLLCFTEEGMLTVPEESQTLLQTSLSPNDYAQLQSSQSKCSNTIEVRFWVWDWLQKLLP